MGLRWIKAEASTGAHTPLRRLTKAARRGHGVGDQKMKTKTLLLAAAAFTACAAPAFAQTSVAWEAPKKGDFLVSGRVTDVSSQAEDAITTAAGADTGLKVDVHDSVMPTLGFTYFLTDHFAVEAILGTTKHEIRAQGGTTDVAVHETWVLPPVVTLQYRPLTEGRFSPYVGAGLNYTIFWNEAASDGLQAAVGPTSVHLKDSVGWAAQAGVDIDVTRTMFVNLDVKYIDIDTTARLDTKALGSQHVNVKLDPLVFGVGVGWRL